MDFQNSFGAQVWQALAALGISLLLVLPAAGQTPLTTAQRIEKGLERSKQWCAHCHIVEPGGQAVAQSDVPSFASIAAREGQTVEKTENGIFNPHPPMPDLQLSRVLARDLALYIMSLKP